ncbi:MAG: hypothetical protein QXI16_07430 [Sulfolobaceae archaeon]
MSTQIQSEKEKTNVNETEKKKEVETQNEKPFKNETNSEKEIDTEKEKPTKREKKSNKTETKTESKKITKGYYLIEREGNRIKKMIPIPEPLYQPQTQIQPKQESGGNNWIWGLLTIVGIIGLVVLVIWWAMKQ